MINSTVLKCLQMSENRLANFAGIVHCACRDNFPVESQGHHKKLRLQNLRKTL